MAQPVLCRLLTMLGSPLCPSRPLRRDNALPARSRHVASTAGGLTTAAAVHRFQGLNSLFDIFQFCAESFLFSLQLGDDCANVHHEEVGSFRRKVTAYTLRHNCYSQQLRDRNRTTVIASNLRARTGNFARNSTGNPTFEQNRNTPGITISVAGC